MTSVIIDKLTNSIEDATTGKRDDTEITYLEKANLKGVMKKHGWQFSWKEELRHSNRQVHKLVIRGDGFIQGLISLQIMDGYVEMHLIEAAPRNIGPRKRYAGVAGNLVAYACKLSFDLGFNGFVAFTSKTDLIQHYHDSLGAELIFGNRMTIATKQARKLVNSYYEGYFNK